MLNPRRRTWAVLGLTGPAYLWLAVAVFLPLSAMLYFSFLTVAPFGGREAAVTLKHYQAFLDRDFYQVLTWRSLKLGLHVTFWCIVIGYPAALALARYVPGRWREALLLMVVLPFWSNALVRVFSWTMVLREGGLLDSAVRMIVPGAEPFDVLFTYDAIVIGLVHSFLPYMILTCYVSLQAIDGALIEAARTLGAPGWVDFPAHHPAAQCAGAVRGRDPDLRAGDRLVHGGAHPRRKGRHPARHHHRGSVHGGVQLAARGGAVVHPARHRPPDPGRRLAGPAAAPAGRLTGQGGRHARDVGEDAVTGPMRETLGEHTR